jgi:ribonuclease III
VLNFLINSITRTLRDETELRKKIRSLTGFNPGKICFYRSALTHKSLKYKGNRHTHIDNERLEFLGDAILSSVIADFLFANYPQCKEGFLTKMRSKMVNRENLNQIAVKLGFDKLVLLNITGVPVRKHVFGNALEAIIGAIYLDKGYKKAKKFIINTIIKMHPDLDKLACEDRDFKSRIIQWGQKNKQEISFESYEVNQVNMNEPAFVATVHIMDSIAGEGSGTTKKEAQQHAARQALENLPS